MSATNNNPTGQDDPCDQDFDYQSQINPNLSSHGNTIGSITHNINAVSEYQQALLKGGGKAQKTPGALGLTRMMKTTIPCQDVDDPDMKPSLHIYQNTKPPMKNPDGSHADYGILAGIKTNIKEISSNINGFSDIFSTTPSECKHVTIKATCGGGIQAQSGYLKTSKIETMDPCVFVNNTNPLTGESCDFEGFQNITNDHETWHHRGNNHIPPPKKTEITKHVNKVYNLDMPEDPVIKVYYVSVGLLMMYILMKMIVNKS